MGKDKDSAIIGNGEPVKTQSSRNCMKINKETLPLKVTLFLFSGAMAAILPYLTIHMQEIGITIQETAIIYAVLPFTSFLGPPLMGILADKFGQYKPVLILATIANGLFHTSLLTIPSYKEISLTESISFKFSPFSDEAYLVPFTSSNCNEFVTAFSKLTNFEATEIFSCTTPSEFDELIQTKCKIEFQFNGTLHQVDCASMLSSDTVRTDSEESNSGRINLATVEDTDGNCSLRVDISRMKFLSEREITCATNLSFPTGKVLIQGSNAVTFWSYFMVRILATIFGSSCFSLLDATTLAIVKKHGEAEYGKERIWSVLGFGTFSPIAGLLVDQISRSKGYTDYSAAFYLSNILIVLTILVLFLMSLEVEKPEKGVIKNVQKLFKYPEVMVFLIMIFILGSLWGFVESYLFIFLKELDAPNYLLGLTLSVGSVAGIPFSYKSEKIFNRFGRVNMIVLAFLTYFVRFFGYSYITSPFWCFPFEAMEAFTYHTMWIAAATYCSELAPKGMLATLMGVMGSLHYGLGKGNGGFIGGYMIGAIKTRLSFRYMGIVAGLCGIFFFFLHYFWLDSVVRRRLVKVKGSVSDVNIEDADNEEELKTMHLRIDEEEKLDGYKNGVGPAVDETLKAILPKVTDHKD